MKKMLAIIFWILAIPYNSSAEIALRADQGVIRVVETGEKLNIGNRIIEEWAHKSVEAVSLYFGHFPIPEVDIVVVGKPGKGVTGGRTEPLDPVTITVFVGTASTQEDLMQSDWVMVHEMIHTALPWLPQRNSWFHEGVAVYVESVARVQAGHLTQEIVLRDFLRQMPRGLEEPGGFANTHSWAKTYWGGALFCLIADVEIRRRTANKSGLQDALRGINASGNYGSEGSLDGLIAIGDKATGTDVLADLYAQSAREPMDVDLDALWRSLGIKLDQNGEIELDNSVPDAPIRNAIFAARRASEVN